MSDGRMLPLHQGHAAAARRAGASTAAAPTDGDAIAGVTSIWDELDSGDGAWENVPAILRRALRVLIRDSEQRGSQIATLESSVTHARDDLRRINARVDDVAQTLAGDLHTLSDRIATLHRLVDGKADAVATASELQRKAEASDVAVMTETARNADAAIGAVRADVAALERAHAGFKAEAQAGIIAATQGANEARAAVGAAVSAMAVNADGFATMERVAGLAHALTALQRQCSELEEAVSSKAAVDDLNRVLATKANKVTVAAALHKKLSASHVGEALAPLAARVADLERTLTGVQSSVAAGMPAKDAPAAAVAAHVSSTAAAEERLRALESRLLARIDETAYLITSRPSAADVTQLQEDVAMLRMELQALRLPGRERSASAAGRASDTETQPHLQRRLDDLQSAVASLQRRVDAVPPRSEHRSRSRTRSTSVPRRAGGDADSDSSEVSYAPQPPPSIPRRDPHGLDIELRCTRKEVAALAGEVESILQLLATSDVEVHRTAASNLRASMKTHTHAAPPLRISATTAVTSLRGNVTQLLERIAMTEAEVTGLRRDVTRTRSECLEARDTLLKHAALLAGGAASRAPRATAEATAPVDGPPPSDTGSSVSTAPPPLRSAGSSAASVYYAPHDMPARGATAITPTSSRSGAATTAAEASSSGRGPRWRDTHPPLQTSERR